MASPYTKDFICAQVAFSKLNPPDQAASSGKELIQLASQVPFRGIDSIQLIT